LKIIGDGPLREEVYSWVSLSGNIEYLGKLERSFVFETIRKCSFLIFPSQCYETMGMVLMESFAFSKPVLASNLGAIQEFVIHGVNGLLFMPGNVKDLTEKIAYLFSHKNERLEMGKNANKIYRERFNREKSYNDLISIYKQTLYSK
jgi:glycosyltransferase involved in cell wall biosynthesis